MILNKFGFSEFMQAFIRQIGGKIIPTNQNLQCAYGDFRA